ncbi:MAG: DNA-methyltransferase [Candidatus Methylomirabilales bacterium]
MVTVNDRISSVRAALEKDGVAILPPQDVLDTFDHVASMALHITTTILDPWYNKGVGGIRPDYYEWLEAVFGKASPITEHIFLWGFPEIIAKMVDRVPRGFELVAWLTWYYKNCPSVIRGWRSSQLACLHVAKPSAKLYPEHFLNNRQLELLDARKLRYMPAPASVIEAPLQVGFVGKNENVGHPAQKPLKVFEPLILMSTDVGDVVLDPMCGSGTTGVVCRDWGRRAILCDASHEYVEMTEKRLGMERVPW